MINVKSRFHVDPAQFASLPAELRGFGREDVRLLVGSSVDNVHSTHFSQIGDHLHSGDVLVVNDSAMGAHAFDAVGQAGSAVLHVGSDLGSGRYVVEVRSAPDATSPVLTCASGQVFFADNVRIELVEPYLGSTGPGGEGVRLWEAAFSRVLAEIPGRRPIAYGYVRRGLTLEHYQTVFGRRMGSAEMPSAGRPFTLEMVHSLQRRGVDIVTITLHTGLSSQEVGELPQPEWCEVREEAVDSLRSAHLDGRRVIAVGTSATRAVETAARGGLAPFRGWTDRIISEEDPPAIVTGLVTGWHDAEASHLALVEAVAGVELTQAAYAEAVKQRYLWHEFGDSALLTRR